MVVSWLLSSGGAHLTQIEYWPVNTITWGWGILILRHRRSLWNLYSSCTWKQLENLVPGQCLGWPGRWWARPLQHQPPAEGRASGLRKQTSQSQPHTWLQISQPHSQWGAEPGRSHSWGSWGGLPGSQDSSHKQGPRQWRELHHLSLVRKWRVDWEAKEKEATFSLLLPLNSLIYQFHENYVTNTFLLVTQTWLADSYDPLKYESLWR